ncbi:MAG: CvpA family protein [Muribaculaceae bacterium]|nr:CvpA family protein [Muribaculaceae bacterium]
MGILDIIILLTLIIAGAYGYWKGIVVQVGSLAGVVVGILFCRLFGTAVADFCGAHLFDGMGSANTVHYISLVVACVTLFVVGYAMTRLLANLVHVVAKSLKLNVVDRIAGTLFSIFEWMLVLSILMNLSRVVLNRDLLQYSQLADGSVGRAVAELAPVVFGYSY